MTSKWELNENSTGILTLEFSGEEWTKALDASFEKNSKDVKIDGFREGKVPRSVYEKKYGVESLHPDAIDFLLAENYTKGLIDNNIQPVGYPDFNGIEMNEEGTTIKLLIAVTPELTLGELEGIEVEVPVTAVTDELVNSEVQVLLSQNAELVVKEGTVETGDIAVIDFAGYKDDVAFDGGTAENHSLEIGSGQFIPGFEDQVVGMSVGEEKDINVTFPEEYGVEELAGAPVVFKVKVNEIKNREVPELTDEFVSELEGEANTVEELKAGIKSRLEANVEAQKTNAVYDRILDEIASRSSVEIPEQMTNSEVTRMIEDLNKQLTSQGMSLDQYYQFTGMTVETIREDMKGEALKRVKQHLILDKLVEKFEVKVTEDDLNAELSRMAAMYSMEVAAIEQAIGGKANLEYSIMVNKALEAVKEMVVIKEVAAE